jgi:four helix bundle protein
MSEKKSILKEKSFLFAIRIVKLYKTLCDNKREFVLSKQILRCGTSVGANIREAQNAQSKADFIHKLSISQKECDETLYWLELLYETEFLTETEFISFNNDAGELLKMLRSAIISTKKNS